MYISLLCYARLQNLTGGRERSKWGVGVGRYKLTNKEENRKRKTTARTIYTMTTINTIFPCMHSCTSACVAVLVCIQVSLSQNVVESGIGVQQQQYTIPPAGRKEPKLVPQPTPQSTKELWPCDCGTTMCLPQRTGEEGLGGIPCSNGVRTPRGPGAVGSQPCQGLVNLWHT